MWRLCCHMSQLHWLNNLKGEAIAKMKGLCSNTWWLCVAIYRLYSSHVEARYWHLKDCLLHIRSQEIPHRKSINCQSSTQAKAHCQSCSLVVGSNPSLQLYY